LSRTSAPNLLMVYPRFGLNSFWNYKATCELVGTRYSAAPLGLITVAAMLPRDWNIRLVDCNIVTLDEADLRWADLVLTGGMLPQQRDTLRIVARAHSNGKPVLVGGPDVTSSPDEYAVAEFRLIGEAEGIIDKFIESWRSGDSGGTFRAGEFPDITRSPIPRFDLLNLRHYMHVGVQRTRGCPFVCEFCNVIELNGRKPRSKSTAQVLRELDALYHLGYRGHVDFVDDNLIGNPVAVKPFLAELAAWLKRRRHPFEFTTEVSINLAQDDELLRLMRDANFFAVFVGIETPDKEALRLTNKKQNLRIDIRESVRRINEAGIYVNAGFIIGFDSERDSVAPAMIECIEETAIPVCMVGLLYALPQTQLSRRLLDEGRLQCDSARVASDDLTDQCTSGLNFATLRPRREILKDYRLVLDRIYGPEKYFGRAMRMSCRLDMRGHRVRVPFTRTLRDLRTVGRILWRSGVLDREARGPFWSALLGCALRNPRAIRAVVAFSALYLHYRPFSRFLDARLEAQIQSLVDSTPWH